MRRTKLLVNKLSYTSYLAYGHWSITRIISEFSAGIDHSIMHCQVWVGRRDSQVKQFIHLTKDAGHHIADTATSLYMWNKAHGITRSIIASMHLLHSRRPWQAKFDRELRELDKMPQHHTAIGCNLSALQILYTIRSMCKGYS